MRHRVALLAAALAGLPAIVFAADVYRSDFDGLSLGPTLPYPGDPGQDGWVRGGAHTGQYGEFQDLIANGGRAYHHHTDAINAAGLGMWDTRALTSPDLTANPYVILSADFYCVTSDLDATNFFGSRLNVYEVTSGFRMTMCDLRGSGPRRQVGISLTLDYFGGSGNPPLPLSVGQHLTYNAWHHMQLVSDEASGNYVALTVDGATQVLTSYAMPRANVNGQWIRGTQLQQLQMMTYGGNTDTVQTSDDVYWDNVSLSVAPAAPAGGCCLPTGECFVGPQEVCASIAGSTYFGDGTTCDAQPCPCTVCPPNDACDGASEVAIPSTTFGSTKLARNDNDASVCGGTSAETAPGVWYKLVGNWHTLTASTCNSSPYYDMQIAVYCGDCGYPTCVVGNDDGCWGGYGEPSKVTWCARYGLTYWIRVYGWGGQVGDFQLDISDDGMQCIPTPECEPPIGPCCVHSACTLVSEAECASMGGVYHGDGGFCDPYPCPVCRGDADCSGAINFDDINYFVAALAGQESGWSSYYSQQHNGVSPPCTVANCDANGGGTVDFDDINPFVDKLVTAPACP